MPTITLPPGPTRKLYLDRKRAASYVSQPAIVVEDPGDLFRLASEVEILGPSRFVHDRKAPYAPAAWIETNAELVLKTENV